MVACAKLDNAPTAVLPETPTAAEEYIGTSFATGQFRVAANPTTDPVPHAVKNWHIIIDTESDDGTAVRSKLLRLYIEEYRTPDGGGEEYIAYLQDIPSASGYGESLDEAIESLVDLVVFDFLRLRHLDDGLSLDAKERRDSLTSLFTM